MKLAPDARFVLLTLLAFAAVSLTLNVLSDGFLEADGITHYLYARWAFAEPYLFTNVWGRPVATSLYAFGAQLPGTLFGQPMRLVGVRATSMMVAVVTALLAWRVAAGQGDGRGHDRPRLVVLFLLAQPLVILHSISELTELPFAMLSMLGLLAYQRRWWWVLALAIGLTPAARPEGFGLLLLAGGALLVHRRWELLLLPLPLIVWDRLGWWSYGGSPGAWWQVLAWLRDNWPYSEQSTYQSGPLLKFVGMLPAATGPMLLPLVLIGSVAAGLALRPGRRAETPDVREAAEPLTLDYADPDVGRPPPQVPAWRDWRDHGTRVGWTIVFIPWFVLVVHSLLHWTGKMASSGDVRYLVAVAPFWALLAGRGFDTLADRLAWNWPARRVTTAAVGFALTPLVVLQLAYPVVPLEMDQPGRDAIAVADWYAAGDLARTHPHLVTDHPVVWYRLDLDPQQGGGGQRTVLDAAPGSVFLWHEVYSQFNADARYVVPADLPPAHGWEDVTPAKFPPGWKVFVTPPSR